MMLAEMPENNEGRGARMGDLGHELWFGCFLTPDARQAEAVVELARLSDRLGLDVVGIQDHPYQARFLDTWTLLSLLAAETERIRLLPDVINLPLRPPAVLARAAASLDLLSGGRVELGLGTGAFWDAVVAMGGPRREPGEAIAALEEAIRLIRALWTPGPPVTLEGAHYRLRQAQPGPIPAHRIGIWLGAYKPRMLRLTGRLADGWIPSMGYAQPSELSDMTRLIDEAAQEAGRDPAAIRRAYNLNGRFATTGRGYLQGPPQTWIEQLTELVLEQGMSVFILGPAADAAGDLRRFAEEVAPGVREAVARARGDGAAPPPPIPENEPSAPGITAATPRRTGPAPRSAALDESKRPHVAPTAGGPVTAIGRESQETLLQVHEHLRTELAELREAAAQVAAGALDPAAARTQLNRMAMRQNYWTLGAFCAQYCRVVSIHHTIEDYQMFPSLRREDKALMPVLDRLHWEHEVIAEQIDRVDRALVAMMNDPAKITEVQRAADDLGDMLLSHLAYEEDQLLGPLGRLEIAV
jgi:alkanesulfonate monooxygenase SsuD/methylene tetrahydromethanopterin reductase-like flavin-dependent oxidoreductase (luciferase family)/hemerythrin-like domain-containing protein